MNLQNIQGLYYILFPLSVLTMITDSFKILEARKAIALGNWEQGIEKYNLAYQEKLVVCSTHYSTENAMFSEGQIPDSRAFSQADKEEEREKKSYGVLGIRL